MRQDVRLIDGQRRHNIAPETFDVPSTERISALKPGSFAKIGVEFSENAEGMEAERFWVEILERQGDDFVGRVDNALFFTEDHGLRLDDRIAFSREHILDTDT